MQTEARPLPGFKDCHDLRALVEISGALRTALAEKDKAPGGRPWAGIHGLTKLLVHGCQRHIQLVEAEGGFLAEVERRLGRPQALVLMDAIHRKLLKDAEVLESQLRDEVANGDLAWKSWQMVRQFHEDMEKHEKLEVDLIQEMLRDVGTGD